jgi:hypothetical protein
VTLQQARKAKAKLARMLRHVPELQGLGIAMVEGGFGLKVNLARQVSSPEIPAQIDGVPVVVVIVGGVRAL